MSNFGQRMKRVMRDYTLHQSPSNLLWEYGFFTGAHIEPCFLKGDQVFLDEQCVVKLEINGNDQIRAIFLGVAGPVAEPNDASAAAVVFRSGSASTPWFEYDDRMQLASIVADRLRLVL